MIFVRERPGVRVQIIAVLVSVLSSLASAQGANLRVAVHNQGAAVAAARVIVAGETVAVTGADGLAIFDAAAGPLDITIVAEGFQPLTVSLNVGAGGSQEVAAELTRQLEEQITVSATRSDARLEDLPQRVEVLTTEEIEEKVMMTPGDIVMMLNEMGGMRVQATSPSLGAASVRVQGMRGRYTRFLSDGLPLFGTQVGGLGLLQIPPTDLGQVEVIKGVASALYGAGAMGGVVNLVSRRPTETVTRDLLFNRSSRGATDTVAFLSGPLRGNWSATLLSGGHWQTENDIDRDGWADLAGYQRGEVRPRLFWDNREGRSLFLTAGATWESRAGGTLEGAVLRATGAPHRESLDTGRFDVGGVAQTLAGDYVVMARGNATWQNHDQRFAAVRERDRHQTAFAEVSARRHIGRHLLVGGAAVERASFSSHELPQFSFGYTTPGVFLQDDITVSRWLTVSGSARLDHATTYGTFLSPMFSALTRMGAWSTRASIGAGFYPTTPLNEETEAGGLTGLKVVGPLAAERGTSASVDLTRTQGRLSHTVTLFASRIKDPVKVTREPVYTVATVTRPTTNRGVELLATWRAAPVSITANYAYVHAREFDRVGFRDVPLTPRHSVGVVGMWEREDVGRVGIESYYTGRQELEASPYRSTSEPYTVVGVLVERVLGKVRLFINGENLTNVRQTRVEPLVRSTPGADGRWTVDAWAPLDGRNVNGGVRLRF
jgi:outer membrane receptor for ferrienterochelin and colicins